MIRKDGEYIIYIIKHLYMSEPSNGWSCSGDCGQWLGHKMEEQPGWNARHALHDLHRPLFDKFNAIGDCWQETGVKGSYNRDDAIQICNLVASWFPQHKFKVCKVDIKQKTTTIAEFNYNE